jgi:hypothetical protein
MEAGQNGIGLEIPSWAGKTKSGPVQPMVGLTVADVHRRTAELLWTPAGTGLVTVGEIRQRLRREFGDALFEAAVAEYETPNAESEVSK